MNRSSGSTCRPTRCRPTPPSPTAPIRWEATTLVLVEVQAGGTTGLGYSYADTATARLVRDLLADVVRGRDAMAVAGSWSAMVAAIRNLGRPGIASMAISAVDAALWDLKARLLDLPLVTLLGAAKDVAPVYGSGGFTSYSIERAPRTARRLGRRRHPASQDEDRQPSGSGPRPGSAPPARPSGPRPSYSSTPMAPIAASRPWPRPSGLPT